MRLANLDGRAVLLHGNTATDVAQASAGTFGPDPMSVWADWEAFVGWAAGIDGSDGTTFDEERLGAPVPWPRQIFAIGLNYKDHADESGFDYPEHLVVFTKFASCLAGPRAQVPVPGDTLDYEAELVVVVGRQLHGADEDEARGAIAGYSVGQDFSERAVQQRPPAPQFSMGKSFPNCGPFGPAVVTTDELPDPDALSVRCVIEGPTARSRGADGTWTAQDGTTRDLLFPVARVLSELSRVVTLYPGDIVFTGTPAGVGMPQGIALQPGDVVTTTIEGVGSLRNEMVAPQAGVSQA